MTGTTEQFIAAAQAAGLPWIADLNDVGPDPVSGVGAVPLNIVDGVRTGSGAGFLLPALSRPNLILLERTRAVRLRLSGNKVVGWTWSVRLDWTTAPLTESFCAPVRFSQRSC